MLHNNRSRRGIVLLVVLSLLTLFVLIAVTFAVVAGHYKYAAQSAARSDAAQTPPEHLLHNMALMLLRDTTDAFSSIHGQGILRDLYGDEGFTAELASAATVFPSPPAGTPVFMNLTVTNVRSLSGAVTTLSSIEYEYRGRVLTFVEPPAVPRPRSNAIQVQGVSTRIVGFNPSSSTFTVLIPPSLSSAVVLPEQSTQIVVNGRAFGGAGFGYDIATRKLNSTETGPTASLPYSIAGVEAALLPNYAGAPLPIAGGANESYDAADEQNMALAIVLPGATSGSQIKPSFHSPALINYWRNKGWSPAIERRVLFRPGPAAHPNFTGSNSAYNELVGPWDVDNDGDGVADSIWIDPGFPPQTGSDGRLYKPLFAVLCQDLDGRLNFNAHGRISQSRKGNQARVRAAGAAGAVWYPLGQAYGPPEISLGGLATATEIFGIINSATSGRYGSNSQPGGVGYDWLARTQFFELPQNYTNVLAGPAADSVFRTPADLHGELEYSLDTYGQLNYDYLNIAVAETRQESPYEANLVTPRQDDRHFTYNELETVLRGVDADAATLPTRLSTFIGRRQAITTASFSIPSPTVNVYSDFSAWSSSMQRRVGGPVEMLAVRMFARGAPLAQIKDLLPFELIQGTRMDLNRPFGDGRDGNGNQIVDDAEEVMQRVWADVGPSHAPAWTSFGGGTGGIAIDPTNGLPFDVSASRFDSRMARQLFARQLYVLMLCLMDHGSAGAKPAPTIAREVAQWAINVVDFRDADSIRTPFEYDDDPFDGWQVDGVLNGYLGIPSGDDNPAGTNIVWGVERPELLITETLAFHDRRREDRDDEVPNGAKTTDPDPMKRDTDFDQRLRPRGPCFIELFNPWTGNSDKPASELGDVVAPPGIRTGVDLKKQTPNGAPVWRLVVTTADLDPGDSGGAAGAGDFHERRIYFCDPGVWGRATNKNQVDYYATAGATYIRPGEYAVLGGRGVVSGGTYITPIGRRTGATEGTLATLQINTTRRIELTPGAANGVRILNNRACPTLPPPPMPMPPLMPPAQPPEVFRWEIPAMPVAGDLPVAHAIIMEKPGERLVNFSISEPTDGYSGPGWNETTPPGDDIGVFNPPLDTPLDVAPELTQNTTTKDYKFVHLQRVANPLANYDAVTNPYLTVDSMGFDLTSFNGVASDAAPSTDTQFYAVQRGDHERGTTRNRFLWAHEPRWSAPPPAPPPPPAPQPLAPPPAPNPHRALKYDFSVPCVWNNSAPHNSFREGDAGVVPATPADHVFPFLLRSSLGHLSHQWWPYVGGNGGPFVTNSVAPPAVAMPPFPFSQLQWNNRPFVNEFELLQVPFFSSFGLLRNYTVPAFGVAPPNPYVVTESFFEHLPKFHAVGSNVFRLFEFVHVPSRFAGTETIFHPKLFESLNWPLLVPPFNRFPMFRVPGRVNLNTVYDPRIYQGLFGDPSPLAPQPTFDQWIDSRRGFSTAAAVTGAARTLVTPNSTVPTMIANPLRAAGSGSLVPLTSMERADVDTTLLRSSAVDATTTPAPVPLFLGGSSAQYHIHDRNSYFRYHSLERLGNLVTCQSNVYAIWITVGYFAVNGTQLEEEVGTYTGEIKRHRAFYVVDRSIPVAFQPGENHNVDNVIVLRRFLD